MAKDDAGARLDDGLGALIPRDRLSGRLLEILSLLGDVPVLGNIVKPMVLARGWWLDDRKPDRIFPVLLAVKDKLHEAEKKLNEYVLKEEFKDLFEETLHRIADEPDDQRRESLKTILLKVMDQPKDHATNRLFLRLEQELSTDAHKILTVLKMPIGPTDAMEGGDALLAKRSGVSKEEIKEVLDELARGGLIVSDHRGQIPRSTNNYLLTRLGRDFLDYRSGT